MTVTQKERKLLIEALECIILERYRRKYDGGGKLPRGAVSSSQPR